MMPDNCNGLIIYEIKNDRKETTTITEIYGCRLKKSPSWQKPNKPETYQPTEKQKDV